MFDEGQLYSPVTTGSAQVFQVTARVRPEVPGGTVMDPVSAVVEGTQSGASVSATTGSVEQTVSATSTWDLSINGAESADDSAFVKQATVQKCTPRITNGDGSDITPVRPVAGLKDGRVVVDWSGGYVSPLALCLSALAAVGHEAPPQSVRLTRLT